MSIPGFAGRLSHRTAAGPKGVPSVSRLAELPDKGLHLESKGSDRTGGARPGARAARAVHPRLGERRSGWLRRVAQGGCSVRHASLRAVVSRSGAIRAFFSRPWRSYGGFRLVPTNANRQPAFAVYCRSLKAPEWRAHSIQVLTIQAGSIAALTKFLSPPLFRAFGLPADLPNLGGTANRGVTSEWEP
jgi:hypothetical protein